MEDGDPEGDYRTFRVNFTGEGLVRLRERVKEKLKEFLGDYTDDTLAEYVIVLLRNGRHKEEARKELNVFLEDDSVAFVSWLWDHLSSNLYVYVHPNESLTDGGASTSSILEEKSGRFNEKLEHASANLHSDSENGTRRIVKVSSSRRNREWRGLAQDEIVTPLLRSTTNENFPSEERTLSRHSPIKRSPSPGPQVHQKRRRQDERQMTKKDVSSKPVLGAPSRLLQFAVRDAVRTVQQAATRSEPASKRLRSVVSSSTVDPAPDETHQRTRPVARVPGGIATAIRAAAEAANDATRVRSLRNVFSRLGHGADEVHVSKESSNFRESMAEDEKYEDLEQNPRSKDWDYLERNEFDGESMVDTGMVNEETGMASDSGSDIDGYNNIEISRHGAVDASQIQSSASALQDKDALTVQSSVAQHTEEAARKTRSKDQESPVAAASNASHKIVNISVNVNTWKPPHYQARGETMEVSKQMAVEKVDTGERNLAGNLPTGNNTTLVKNTDVATCAGAPKDVQKSTTSTTGSYSTARPSEDAHSRTIFVSNVHFAATKDTLSRHFNKFGEVLKVVIVTDAATGQSKGSAYVEFLRKESAELALSLNGTSFMSRILKVVRSSAHHEAAAMMPWPRSAWTSSYPSRLARIPFPRGIMGGAFRGRLPIKPGARSLQWKRGAPTNPPTDASKNPQNTQLSGNSLPSPTARSLTYVRSEPKSDANSTPV